MQKKSKISSSDSVQRSKQDLIAAAKICSKLEVVFKREKSSESDSNSSLAVRHKRKKVITLWLQVELAPFCECLKDGDAARIELEREHIFNELEKHSNKCTEKEKDCFRKEREVATS
eukprot:IDg16303t1